MLIVSDLINNKTQIVESLKKRNKDFSKEIDLVIDFDKKRRTTQSELDQILSQQNQLSKRIGEYYKSGDQSSGNELKKQVEALKPEVKKLEKNLNEIKSELFNSLNNIPNVPHHSVKEGKGEEDNEIIYQSTDIIKLAIKRMIPKGPLGRVQLSNCKIFSGSQHNHEAQKPETLDISKLNKKNITK